MNNVTAASLQVARTLYDFVNEEAIPGTGVGPTAFWHGAALVRDLAPRNKALLRQRDALQAHIGAWHLAKLGYDR